MESRERPDAARNADRMLPEARAAAQEPANAPTKQDAEKQAQVELATAGKGLRDVAGRVEDARNSAETPDPKKAAGESRKSLETARDVIEEALDDAAANNEADCNSPQAGMRRPCLESALDRIKRLLHGYQQLEDGLADEAAGRTPTAKAQAFGLGDLSERVCDLQRDLRNQKAQQKLGQAGKDLQAVAAVKNDQELQEARDRLDRLLEKPPTLPKSQGEFQDRDEDWQKIRKAGQAAPQASTSSGQEALDQVGKDAENHAEQRNSEASEANSETSDKLGEAAKELADRLQQSSPEASPEQEGQLAADAAADAARQLDDAKKAVDERDTDKASELVNKAMASLDKARSKHRRENPDAARTADRMASEARAAEQELAKAPIRQDAEKQAQAELDKAVKALRDVAGQVEAARDAKKPKKQPVGSVREGWSARDESDTEGMIRKLTQRIREEPRLAESNRTVRLLGTLGAELDLRMRNPANRYSVEKSMLPLWGLESHPDIGVDFASLRDATCLDFGCGGLNPAGGLLAMLLAGAKRGIAVDLDDVQSPPCAARSLYAVFAAALSQTSRPRIPATADQIFKRVDSFDWDKLAYGDIEGVDWSRLTYIQQTLSDAAIADASIDVLVSNSVFEHLPDPESIIAEMARVVRPGGLCVHSIDGVDHRSYRNKKLHVLEFLGDDSQDELIHGCNRIRPLSFQPMFEKHGFEVRGILSGPRVPLTTEIVQGFAPQFRELPHEHLEVSHARFYLRRR